MRFEVREVDDLDLSARAVDDDHDAPPVTPAPHDGSLIASDGSLLITVGAIATVIACVR
jgi:hypothetical protein